jgi:hypothetical protein
LKEPDLEKMVIEGWGVNENIEMVVLLIVPISYRGVVKGKE